MEHERGAFKVNYEPLPRAVKNWRKSLHLRPNRAIIRACLNAKNLCRKFRQAVTFAYELNISQGKHAFFASKY
jgi:hypothetical protein